MNSHPELPLEMGNIRPHQAPVNLVIGVCHDCGRRGLLNRFNRRCTGYRAVTVPGDLVQVPEARSIRCNLVALRRHSKANRKIADVRKPELRLS